MAMETTFLTSVLPNQSVLSTSESTDSLNRNLLIKDIHLNFNSIMDRLNDRIDRMMDRVSNILDGGLNGDTDSRIDRVIDGVDGVVSDTVDQVNTIVDSYFQINPDGAVDPLTGEMIIPSIHQPAFERVAGDPMAIDTSPIVGELAMDTANLQLDETVTVPPEIGTNEPLLNGTGNLLAGMGTNEPLLDATVDDYSLF